MKNVFSFRFAAFLIVIALYMSGCAVVPRCPGFLLPIIETQINISPGSEDDYLVTSGFTSCQVRITNFTKLFGGLNFPGGVTVEIRNIPSSSTLLFLNAGAGPGVPTGSGTASIFATIPGNGDFLQFFVKGTVTNAIDKSAIFEIATSGASCNETVLSRTAAMVPDGAPPIVIESASPRVQLEVGSQSRLDDYLSWAPTPCRIKWLNPGSATATLNVRLQNMTGTNRLRFADSALAGNSTATNATLNLSLPGTGQWVSFFAAGNFLNPSINDKDAVIDIVTPLSGALIGREAAMVRIRKNANTFSSAERNRYLETLKKVNLTYNNYIDFLKTHARDNTGVGGSTLAYRQAHRGSAFLPWHRSFVLHLERLLQSIDPSVALPYWKFDDNAPNMFTPDFMGANNTTASDMVVLAATNPIVSWSLSGEAVPTGIQRKTPYGDGGHPLLADETSTLALGGPGFTFALFKSMEGSAHDPAHFRSGATSWIGPDPALAVRDPLFFFLHCNVDRLWAKWQWVHNRHNKTNINGYDLQGSHTTPAAGVPAPAWTVVMGQVTTNRTLGQYGDDTMWPWDNVTGGTIPSTTGRPDIAILTPLPMVLGAIYPGSKPTVSGMVDYLGITNTFPGFTFGFGYDDFTPY